MSGFTYRSVLLSHTHTCLGILRQGQLGELLFAHGPFDDIWMQNVQIIEKFHHNPTSAAKEFGK